MWLIRLYKIGSFLGLELGCVCTNVNLRPNLVTLKTCKISVTFGSTDELRTVCVFECSFGLQQRFGQSLLILW